MGQVVGETNSKSEYPLHDPVTPQDLMATVHGGSLAKIIVNMPGEESREEFLSKPVTTLGRRSSNMIQIPSAIVSGEHARLELTRQGHTITDLGSTNGTYVNGTRIHETAVRPGDRIGVGSVELVLRQPGMSSESSRWSRFTVWIRCRMISARRSDIIRNASSSTL